MAAVFFVAGFVLVLAAYIAFIAVVSARLGPAISPRAYALVERIIISGIVVGTALMIQPWLPAGLQWGFLLLLSSTLAFIFWSHVTPKRTADEAGTSGVSVT
jgi:hypothetical protein